jgi:hypothetical protein
MKKTIVFARHEGDKKEYLFEVPEGMKVKHDDILLVDTIKGKQIARATGDMSTGDYTDDILLRLGAYLPLKRVLAVAGEEIQEYIKTVVIRDIIVNLKAQKQGDLPF